MLLVLLSSLLVLSHVVQFVSVAVNRTTGDVFFPNGGLAVDFTVQNAIGVSSMGLLDADAPGINGILLAQIVDRSTNQIVVGTARRSSRLIRAAAPSWSRLR